MMKTLSVLAMLLAGSLIIIWGCNGNGSAGTNTAGDSTQIKDQYAGFGSEIAYGRHLVTIGGCNDCHTPKKMTPQGLVPDTMLLLSGHPAALPPLDINRNEIESKGLAVTRDMTEWAGPWGVSYSANLTPDSTGIGSWTEAQFMRAIREGKWQGLDGTRPLLPPMPWQELRRMTDEELSAIFAYLKSIKPVSNVVPLPLPPVSASHH
jgi:Cytochrome c